jgi:hypothetical protein
MKLRHLVPIGVSVVLAAAGTAAANAAVTPAAATTITVNSGSGAALSDSFTGFSFEANVLAGTAPSTGNLYQYMKTLGAGVMRFGGNFVDTTFWTSKGESQPSWAVATLTPDDLTRLKTLADKSGWKVILGVTLKQRDPNRAADEAKFAKQILGSSLQAIEIGNEPNYYPNYSPAQYYSDFEAYKKAILAVAPGVGLVGPSIGRVSAADQYITDFTQRETGHVDAADLVGHYYPLCAKSSPTPTIPLLLSATSRDGEKARADLIASNAKKLGIPGLLGEGNSVSCEGKDGVSDVFASALWGVDASLLYAQEGLSGFYLHAAIAKCGAPKPLYKAYTPFCATTDADAATGIEHVRPVYYASLLVQQLGSGKFASVTNSDVSHVRAYALRSGSTLKLVLVNVTDPASNGARSTLVHLGATYTSASTFALTAPSLTTQSNILLGGHFVGKGGTFAGVDTTPVSINGSDLSISLPAGSATVVTLNP